MNQQNIILSIKNVSKIYVGPGYKVEALKETSLHLHEGEFVAIMGTSGSGKSTLLNIVGALDTPDTGEIYLNGQALTDLFENETNSTLYRSENIGFIFQSYHLLKDLTVEENIALPLILKDVPKKQIEQSVSEMVELVGLSKWRRHRPVQLSGGQQQRVAIARALITSPKIILADEPTGNLDFNTSNEILDVIVNMKRKFNQSIFMVTHDPYVASFADRVLFFHDGRVVDEYMCKHHDADMERILQKFKLFMERAV